MNKNRGSRSWRLDPHQGRGATTGALERIDIVDRSKALVERKRVLVMHLKNRRVVEQTDTDAQYPPSSVLSKGFFERVFVENVDPAGLVRSRDRDAELARAHGGCLGTKSR